MIIDCHCHAGIGDTGFNGPWDSDARLDRYLVRARRAGIDRTVVFPVFNNDYRTANARLAAIVESQRPRLIGFAAVDAGRDAGRVAAVVESAVRQGLRGIKVHGHDSPLTREICDAARRFAVPVLVDIVRRPVVVEMAAGQFPDVPFIVSHLGGFADDWMTGLSVIDQMCRYPNVFADTSGVRYFDLLVDAVRRAGPGKLLFGSDGPLLHPGVELAKVRALDLPGAAEADVLGGNLLRLLHGRWSDRVQTRVNWQAERPGR